ncbi:penicillin-binding protein activator [Pseudomaricurvus sp.]|uniref:penicillin-binding protein activator n=1 Tax=Pseudomaricurvus sp. TaxID=2004510 RepID=UPI003F6D1E4C
MRLISNIGRLSLAGLVALSLYGCGGSTPTIDQPDSKGYVSIDVDKVLAQAEASQSPQREILLLQVAQQLNYDKQYARALNLLNSIDSGRLDDANFANYSLIFSETAMADDSYFLAQRILTNPRLNQQWQSLPTDSKITLHQRRADLFMLLGEPEASILERVALEPLLKSQEERYANQDLLWQTLMSMPTSELQSRSQRPVTASSVPVPSTTTSSATTSSTTVSQTEAEATGSSPTVSATSSQIASTPSQSEELRGWYSLALISKNHQFNLDKQLDQINEWVARWPQHPASQRLPKDLQLLQQLIAERPSLVALLLPQQGRLGAAGNAVRDGFVAAYYQAKKENRTIPTLKLYDTSKGNIVDVYNQAVTDGAELIIGPLDKDKVTELSQFENLPVPTLALNYSETEQEPALGLYQFGLSGEDEARQIAQRAWIEGHRYAMILTTDASWGARSGEAFRTAWEAQGGTVINISQFTGQGDYSNVIKQALHINLSEERYNKMRVMLNRPMEFEPRRRQDADMVFLAAQPGEARQVKPTLAFHYASDLQVYATSQVYSGANDPKSDRDLNGIKFSTLPWFFARNNPEKQSIKQAANPSPSYQRLYALGVDSYQLYPRLKQLTQSPYTHLYGVTGSLNMNAQRRIEREQTWAKIVNGTAKALPSVVDNIN